MTDVRIFQPAKTAMQSGRANTRKWILEFTPRSAKTIDGLMGWTGSSDTLSQVRLKFESEEDAVGFAEQNGLSFTLTAPKVRRVQVKNYSDNFSFNRVH